MPNSPQHDGVERLVAFDWLGQILFVGSSHSTGLPSPSAVSQTIKGFLEQPMGVRLLTRTTRSVTQTEAGEPRMKALAPLLEQLEAQLEAVSDLRDHPSGTVRLTADEFAVRYLLWPQLKPVLEAYPDIILELSNDYGLPPDIAAERFDAGVRLGGTVAAD